MARLYRVTQTRWHKGFQRREPVFELSFEPRTLVTGWSSTPRRRSRSPLNSLMSSERSWRSEIRQEQGRDDQSDQQASPTTEIGSTSRSRDYAFFAIRNSSPTTGTCGFTWETKDTKPSVCRPLINPWHRSEQLKNGERFKINLKQAEQSCRKTSADA